ncbi:Glutamate--tRNA ligase [Planctomycetes bacterium MalM25]|nr:Glutamate--tRNA ligase [Planctomycetes bacterium MalM25]
MLTRLAPSPTGALHLGNARTFLINWALARQNGWRVLLRVEDLDGPRIKAGMSEHAIDTLRWLGLDWDGEPAYQSADPSPYRAALERLVADRRAYPCRCTRSQILAASLSAPNEGDHELRYPGTCRPAPAGAVATTQLWEGSPDPDSGFVADSADRPGSASGEASHNRSTSHAGLDDPGVSWRFVTPDEGVPFDDAFVGPQAFNPQAQVGDFLVATKDRQPSYQLAVTVDDARQGVTHIVRGDDLLSCTSRQLQLYDALDLGPRPHYTHLPLVVGEDGRRLAKRHGDTRVSHYRDAGAKAERVVGLLAEWCGLGGRREMTTREFAERFDLSRLPKERVVFTASDDQWLKYASEEA